MNGSSVTIGRSRPRIVIEWGVYLLLAAAFIETWLVKGVVAPCRVVGGSMAPALLGIHRDVVCADCGYHFPCGTYRRPLPPRAVCPNCGYANNDLLSPMNIAGGRLLIDRTAFSLRRPRRWEVAALNQPSQADKILVKRIVGLPGESVEIRGGDVYVDGQIQRKNLAQQRAMAVPVHEAACRPTLPPTPPPRWRGERPESRWESSGGSFTHPAGPQRGPIDWLVYHHRRRAPQGGQSHFLGERVGPLGNGHHAEKIGTVPSPTPAWVESPVTDLYGYNQSRPRREEDVHAVADMMLSFLLTRQSGQGTFHLRVTDGREGFETLLRFDDGQSRYEVRHGGRAIPGASGDLPRGAGRRLIEISLIDRQFLLAFDGRTVARRPFQKTEPLPPPVSTPLAIGVRGLGVTVEGLRIFRDVYYTQPIGLASQGPVRLGLDEYYVLGDNSPVSEDSRHWPNGGAVEADLLVGKPLAAISSVQISLFSPVAF